MVCKMKPAYHCLRCGQLFTPKRRDAVKRPDGNPRYCGKCGTSVWDIPPKPGRKKSNRKKTLIRVMPDLSSITLNGDPLPTPPPRSVFNPAPLPDFLAPLEGKSGKFDFNLTGPLLSTDPPTWEEVEAALKNPTQPSPSSPVPIAAISDPTVDLAAAAATTIPETSLPCAVCHVAKRLAGQDTCGIRECRALLDGDLSNL